jgi:integrase
MTRIKLKHIHSYTDRQGRARHYLRIPGQKGVALPGLPGSPEFMAAYSAAVARADFGGKIAKQATGARPFAKLIDDFLRSPRVTSKSQGTQLAYSKALSPLAAKYGDYPAQLEAVAARKIIDKIAADHPAMANLTISALKLLMGFAVETGRARFNPVVGFKRFDTGEHHTWTDEELAQFEKRWPIGTRERLAYETLACTGQRVSDAVRIRRAEVLAGTIALKQKKTGAEVTIPVARRLLLAAKAAPANGVYLLTNRNGQPISGHALGQFMASAIEAAGLPDRCVAHGLRKALLRRLAENGASTRQIMSVSGHKTLREVERYTEAAERKVMAAAALSTLEFANAPAISEKCRNLPSKIKRL